MTELRRPKRMGDILLEKGVITKDQLSIALTEQKRSGDQLGKALVTLGFVPEVLMRDILSEALGQETVDLTKVYVDAEVLKTIPKDFAQRHRILPLSLDDDGRVLTVAMINTLNVAVLDRVQARLGTEITLKAVMAGESEISAAIDRFYGYELSVDGILREIETGVVDQASLAAQTGEFSHPMVRLVDALLTDAIKREASDIHIEPEDGFVRIRYRIDGVLRQIRSLHTNFLSGITVRLKVMSGMNIAESRTPQDGRISLSLAGRTVDFRVAAQPTTHGENIVLRILDRSRGIVPLDRLGLQDDILVTLKLMMARPEGIILVTGPTGSGKTTTLYSMLNHLNTEHVNIMTLEDPVEYPMAMIRQTSVNEAAKLDFATGIRSLLRQDPDIILVGEIRDEPTAEMALRAAMTGHQVFATLHTNSALGTIPRLLDIGVKPDIMAGNIIGVLAQRLVRKLCVRCREPYSPEEMERRFLATEDEAAAWSSDLVLYRPKGCEACGYIGYRGRMSILEVLKMDDELDDLVSRSASKSEFRRVAVEKGFRAVVYDAMRRVLQGLTNLEETARVVDLASVLK